MAGQAFVATFAACVLVTTVDLLRRDPALVERRMHSGPTAETEPLQKWIQSATSVLFLAFLVVAGLDRRFGWSVVPRAVIVLGDVLIVISFAAILRVFHENTFASSTIELAPDQRVIDSGPYALVRHPMYASALPLFAGIPLALGSWWALLVVPPMIAALVLRIVDEERFLAQHLAGYADYRQRVRWRLIPGLW